jgi:hypothetical protein
MLSFVAAPKKSGNLGVGGAVLVVLLVLAGALVWQEASDDGLISHDRLTIVTAKNWSAGEYKTCTETNIEAMKEEPQIDCSGSRFDDSGERGEPKRFKVRFYGVTYKEELKDKASIVWRCRKNEGTDPTFTCDDQKIMKWKMP